jgi:UDP-2-acetamido-2-deoxy-ribo-hexuluronate aminotransferase
MQFTGMQAQYNLLKGNLESAIGRVMEHGQFIMGPEVKFLEQRLSQFCGSKHAISVANGTDALQIALMAYGVGYGDAVLVPSFTYTATAEVILVLGAIPIFVDVDTKTYNISLVSLARGYDLATREGLRPRAIIAVDLFGLPADWDALNEFANERSLRLISDAAQSFGASTSAGKKVGTLAPVTTASFFPAKPLGCYGDGGAIFTDDDELSDIIKSIRVHGQGKEKYETVRVGMNSRLDTIQAAVLLQKLEVFSDEISKRNALADLYSTALRGHVDVPEKPLGVNSAWAQYTIKSSKRDVLQANLKARNVTTAIYYPKPMHQQKAYERYTLPGVSLVVSERLSAEVLSLPMNPYFNNSEAEAVCDAVLAATGDSA